MPYLHMTSSFVNLCEHRKYVDNLLKEELGSIHVDVGRFADVFFGDIHGIDSERHDHAALYGGR
jgi:hypothetical protein